MSEMSNKERILLVDDTPSTVAMVRTALEDEGYRVFVATTGEKAIKRAALHAPHLILLDIRMPEMDGYETYRHLKSQEATRDIPVIFMSVLTETFDKVKGFDLGAVDYITKPIETAELLARVNTHLRIDRLQRELIEANTKLEEKVSARTEDLRAANVKLREEISERMQMEVSLRKTNRAYKALSECNQALMRATDEEGLLQDVCRIIVEDCGYHLVWIGYAGQDQAQTVRPVAQSGYEEGCLDTIEVTWADTDLGRGPTGTAIRTKKRVINRDILTNPDFAPWKADATKRGYASSAAFPLVTDARVLGALNVYATEPDAFDPGEIDLLTELAGDLAYGIESLRLAAEHAMTELALRESEGRFRSLFESATEIIFILDSDAVILQPNSATIDALGYSEDELIGRRITDFLSRESQQTFAEQFPAAAETGYCRAEMSVVRKGGDFIEVDCAFSCIRDDQGAISLFVLFQRDITERKRAEEALEMERQQLLSIFENMDGPVYVSDRNTYELLYVNDAFREIWGEGVGQQCYRVLRRRESPCWFCTNDRIFGENLGKRHVWDFRDEATDRWFHCIDKAIRWPDGRMVRIETAIEITELRRAEERIEDQRTFLLSLLECLTHPFYVVSADDYTISLANEAAVASGISEGSTCHGAIHGRTAPCGDLHYQCPLDKVKKTGRSVRVEHVHYDKKGSPRNTEVYAYPLLDGEGRVEQIIGYSLDVTEQVILEKQLQQAQKMESIGTLAGGIAHDFNNILQVVLGCADILVMNGRKDSEDLAHLGTIRQAAKDGADLVKGLLTFSRRVESELRPVDLNQQLERVHKILRRTIPRMVEIRLSLADDLKVLAADPVQLEQVLLNLAVNAHHAMPEGGRLTFETENFTQNQSLDYPALGIEPGEYVVLRVSDTGHGMEKGVVERIFEPFYTTKEAGEGTGLGLSIVYGIVKNHGGHITCSSEPGQGTTFTIHLPAIQEEAALDTAMKDGEMLTPGTETVLVVDDDAKVREITEHMLKRSGYTVLTAKDGKQGLAIYEGRKDEIDLVILDLIMPEMGGEQCCNEILRIDPDARVLIASGYLATQSKMAALRRRTRGFIHKPYDVRDLLCAVRKILDETCAPAGRGGAERALPVRITGSEEAHTLETSALSEASTQEETAGKEEFPLKLRILAIDDRATFLKMLAEGMTLFEQTLFTATSATEGLRVFQETPVDLVTCDVGMLGLDGWAVGRRIKEICREKDIPKTPFILLTGQTDMEDIPQEDKQEIMTDCGVDAIVEKPIDIPDLLRIANKLLREGREGSDYSAEH